MAQDYWPGASRSCVVSVSERDDGGCCYGELLRCGKGLGGIYRRDGVETISAPWGGMFQKCRSCSKKGAVGALGMCEDYSQNGLLASLKACR